MALAVVDGVRARYHGEEVMLSSPSEPWQGWGHGKDCASQTAEA